MGSEAEDVDVEALTQAVKVVASKGHTLIQLGPMVEDLL